MAKHPLTPEALARLLTEFLAESPQAVVIEAGEALFDLERSRHSITAERGKCVLHLWSEERNVVRRVLDAELRAGELQLEVQRLGAARPQTMEIVRDRDRRTPSARKAARTAYQARLERLLGRGFPGHDVTLTSTMDISGERSFGPAYCRGLLRRGRSAFAVFGVNADETQTTIDASLTFGLLWLQRVREREAGKLVIEGLRLFLPPETAATARARMARLDHAAAKFELYELDDHRGEMEQLDSADQGNIATRLVQTPEESAVRARFAEAIEQVRALAPSAEVAFLPGAEVAFRIRGLEFARARMGVEARGFRAKPQIVIGTGACEIALSDENAPMLAELARAVEKDRRPEGDLRNPYWRMQPERWLESAVVGRIADLDPRLDPACVYSQVPAFSASDRAMIDVLAATREGRLAVIELKADEDIHLPLQGLDYWARVEWHHERGEFQRFGYFPARPLSPEPALLLLVAPALHVHPATDTLLRFLHPQIEWELLGIDERWREEVRVVFRKRRESRDSLPNRRSAELPN